MKTFWKHEKKRDVLRTTPKKDTNKKVKEIESRDKAFTFKLRNKGGKIKMGRLHDQLKEERKE